VRPKFKLIFGVLTSLISLPASALDLVTPEQFEALTDGKTLYFTEGGMSYGAEQYLKNRRVRWQYPDGQCVDGRWHAQGANLCFEYENDGETQCWIMWREDGAMWARRSQFSTERAIKLIRKDELPLPCAGPDLGV